MKIILLLLWRYIHCIVCATLDLFGMQSPDGTPATYQFPECLQIGKKKKKVVESFENISYGLQHKCRKNMTM